MIVKTFNKLTTHMRQFLGDARGSVNVEGAIFLPFLLATIVATMVFYDAFRKDSLGDKATFTIGDMLSRETDYITPEYVDSAKQLFSFLTGSPDAENTLRVSVVAYNASTGGYNVRWSQVRGGHAMPLTDADLANAQDQLPVMVHAEQVILVDSYLDYDWPVDLGFQDEVMIARVFTRPRFAPQLVWLEN